MLEGQSIRQLRLGKNITRISNFKPSLDVAWSRKPILSATAQIGDFDWVWRRYDWDKQEWREK